MPASVISRSTFGVEDVSGHLGGYNTRLSCTPQLEVCFTPARKPAFTSHGIRAKENAIIDLSTQQRLGLPGATSAARQQLPFWGDAPGWDQPQYYETLQTGRRRNGRSIVLSGTENGNIFNDGCDALLIRGPGGLLTNR